MIDLEYEQKMIYFYRHTYCISRRSLPFKLYLKLITTDISEKSLSHIIKVASRVSIPNYLHHQLYISFFDYIQDHAYCSKRTNIKSHYAPTLLQTVH